MIVVKLGYFKAWKQFNNFFFWSNHTFGQFSLFQSELIYFDNNNKIALYFVNFIKKLNFPFKP